jgi:hypothetical protein
MNIKVELHNIDLVKIDDNDIKIKASDIDLKLRNNLKDFINEKMSNLSIQFKKSILNNDKEGLIRTFEELKSISRYLILK